MPGKKPELTIQDHYIGIVKLALEFSAHIIQVATVEIIADPSRHNRTHQREVMQAFSKMNANYIANLGLATKKIEEQFGEKKETKDESKAPTN